MTPKEKFAAYMKRCPQGEPAFEHVRDYYFARLRRPGDLWRRELAETLTQMRLFRESMKKIPIFNRDEVSAIVGGGVAEIASMRLEIAYRPLFATLDRINLRVAQIAQLSAPTDRDFFAPRRVGSSQRNLERN